VALLGSGAIREIGTNYPADIWREGLRCPAYISRLWTFRPLYNLKLYGIAFLQAFVAFAGDCAVVDEDVRAVIASDKAVTFSVVEPFHSTFQTIHLRPLRTHSPDLPYLLPFSVR
jgi:hypothetical protein